MNRRHSTYLAISVSMAKSNTRYDDVPFVGADTHNTDHTPSLASNGIVMLSPPDTQEESSLPPSSDGVDRCAINHAGRDSDLGFSKALGVDERSHGAQGDVLGGSPVEKSKLSEHELGFGVQLPKVEEGTGSLKGKLLSEENGISMNKNCSEKGACIIVEENKSSDRVLKKRRVLPPSNRCGSKIAASGMECGNSREKKNVFDVLRALSEDQDSDGDDDDENLDNLSLLEVAKARGIAFPLNEEIP